jgi:hypothetical protein
MDRIISDRTFRFVLVIIGIILVIDIANVFIVGGPSVFAFLLKPAHTVTASEGTASSGGFNPLSSPGNRSPGVAPVRTGTTGQPGDIQAIYVPTKATPVPTVNYVTAVTPIRTPVPDYTPRIVASSVQTTQKPEDYALIYSNDLSYLSSTTPTAVVLDVTEPPLIVRYSVSPRITLDSKYFYNHTGTNKAREELLNVSRPSESSWFTVTIYDKATGQELAQDGYGEIFSALPDKTFTWRTAGSFLVQFDGENSDVHVEMLLKKEGNLI